MTWVLFSRYIQPSLIGITVWIGMISTHQCHLLKHLLLFETRMELSELSVSASDDLSASAFSPTIRFMRSYESDPTLACNVNCPTRCASTLALGQDTNQDGFPAYTRRIRDVVGELEILVCPIHFFTNTILGDLVGTMLLW